MTTNKFYPQIPVGRHLVTLPGTAAKLLLASALLAALSGCLATLKYAFRPKEVKVSSWVPAKSTAASTIRDVAVLPFDGRENGHELTVAIEAMLSDVDVRGASYFRVAERSKVDAIMKEMKFMSDGFTSKQTAKIGNMLGVKGLYTGATSQPQFNVTTYRDKRTECADDKCKQMRDVSVSCWKSEAVFEFTPKLINLSSAQIVYSELIRGVAKQDVCDEDRKSKLSKEQLITQARDEALLKFRRSIAPYPLEMRVPIMTSVGDLGDKSAEGRFDSAVHFAQDSRFDRACEIWQEQHALSQQQPALAYNLGICAEVSGDLNAAERLYTAADRLVAEPNEHINTALARIKSKRNDETALSRQMR